MFSNLAIQKLLIECAEIYILPYYQNLAAHDIQLKDNKSIVTIVDHYVENFLSERLQQLIPASIVIGEEDFEINPSIMTEAVSAKNVWIVDPIDGTKNFSDGHPDFAMMVSLLTDGQFAGAWIYAPIHQKMASWIKGEPVCVNGTPVIWNERQIELSDMIGGEHISYHHTDNKSIIRTNRENYFGSCISRGCIGIEWVMMVEGELDFISFAPGNPWDIAAGVAMIQHMGGVAFNLHEKPLTGEELFTVTGAMLATRSPDKWHSVRDAMLKDINWGSYFV